MRIASVRLHEVQELEPRVLKQLSDVEEGLSPLQNQLGLGEPGRPDVLAVAADGALTVLELKSVPASLDALAQLVRYWEWLVEKRSAFARAYEKVNPEQPVRAFLLAQDFDADVRRMASYLSIEVALVRVQSVKNLDTGDIGLLFEPVELEAVSDETVVLRTVQDIIDYVVEPSVKSEFIRILDDCKSHGLEVRTWGRGRGRWLEVRHNGQPVAYLGARQKYFRGQHYDPSIDDFPRPYELRSYDEWRAKTWPFIEPFLQPRPRAGA
jgi:hypothetical protein